MWPGTSNLISLNLCFMSMESGDFCRKYRPCLSQGTLIRVKWFQCFQSFTTKLCCPKYLELFLKFTFGNKLHDNIDLFYLCCQLIKELKILFKKRDEGFFELWRSYLTQAPRSKFTCMSRKFFFLYYLRKIFSHLQFIAADLVISRLRHIHLLLFKFITEAWDRVSAYMLILY